MARLAVAAAVLALVACTATTQPPVTTTSQPMSSSSPTSTTEDLVVGLMLPVDPEVAVGRLDNGLSYYIRENDSPGGRAELRLLVDAGSLMEDPDQAGMAHFLEHMMFNGTDRFPRNELITALEAFGPRFGPDINAHTSFDETVYELSVSTADEKLVQLGVDVLREWAGRATLTETDVIEERGVVLDEWRLRAQGFGARVNDQLEQLVLAGSDYEGHQPIGTVDSITGASPGALSRFYHDWYRPERMTVVAVGDVDRSTMESLIVDAFDDLGTEGDPRQVDPISYEASVEPRAVTFLDEEATLADISLLWAVPSPVMSTVGDYQRSVALSLGLGILADRLGDDASNDGAPILGASVLDFAWTRAIGIHGLDVEVRVSRADDGLESALLEVERVRREGVTELEADRAMEAYAAYSRQVYDQRESIQDGQFTAQIVEHALAGGHLMGPSQRFDVESDMVDRLTKSDIDAAMRELLGGAPSILIIGPDDEGLEIPTPQQALDVWAGLGEAELPDRPEVGEDEGDLMTAPDPAEIVETIVDPRFGFTTLEFANGATVYLWESDIATEAVYARVEGFGGTSQIEVDDLPEAFLMTEIAQRSGVADFDLPALRRRLADRIVAARPWVTETRQGIEGNSSLSDVAVLFQLINLTMDQPRFDQSAVDAVLDEMQTLVASGDDLPDVLFDEAVNYAYYGDDPRYFTLPDSGQIADFDPAVVKQVYAERFGDAADFAFTFVGDFETDDMADLAARYIGTLPGSGEPSGFVDHQPLPRREVQVTTIEAGAGEQGKVGMFFTNEMTSTLKDRLTARLVELILTSRLRERVREALSATYAITASIDLQRDPDAFAEALVMSTGDPSGLDEIVDEVLADIASLQEEGPTDAQFATAVAQLRDDLELIDNLKLAMALVTAHLYPDQPVAELVDEYPLIDQVTPDDIRDLSRAVFDLDQRIEVRQVPRR